MKQLKKTDKLLRLKSLNLWSSGKALKDSDDLGSLSSCFGFDVSERSDLLVFYHCLCLHKSEQNQHKSIFIWHFFTDTGIRLHPWQQ